ncbi:MAG TPA: cellulose synthase operon protein YhjQ/BcsQ [Anaerolineales bacterium]|nr:cellulose synthase operon protein YhjQ/BcsQ [Anaerolineales bacterium]
MPTIAVVAAKGGCGASLVATNLALALTRHGTTLLIDYHNGNGCDDLLLDLKPSHSWVDLLPVADELTPRHLELALCRAADDLAFLAAPSRPEDPDTLARLEALLRALAPRFTWIVIDVPSGSLRTGDSFLERVDVLVIVATADPPALRNARRMLDGRSGEGRGRARLALNQVHGAHPLHPAGVATALKCPLLAALPTDARAVGFQINFGRACVVDSSSVFGKAVVSMARALSRGRISRRAA